MRIIPSPADGTPLAFDVSGEGPALVLLHGSVLSRAIWRGLGYLAPLARERTVIRLDIRGHGRSGAPHDASAYTQDVLLADLRAVMDAVGVAQAALMGYSLGARIALTAALRAPERVERIVCLGGSPDAQEGAVDSLFYPGVIDSLRADGMEAFCAGQGLGPDVIGARAAATRQAFLTADPLAMAALFTATDATPGVPDTILAACEAPALWMAGDLDRPRHEQSRQAAAIMPRGRFVSLPGRTHGTTLSPPEQILVEVLPFLREGADQSSSAPSHTS